MKIAFYQSFLNERGTSVAMFDYAFYNEKILGNESVIIYSPSDARNDASAIKKFTDNFRTYTLDGITEKTCYDSRCVVPMIDRILERENCHVLYQQKYGTNDGVVSAICKNVILVASDVRDVHGDRYVYVSKWLSDVCSGGELPWLPIIIDLPSSSKNFRRELNIPEHAIVFGRTGGMDTWNIPWVNMVIEEVLKRRPDIFFVFQNTPIHFNHPNVKYVQTTSDNLFKSCFINTCDAMLHARFEGESFGQTIAEFSTKNKRIITFGSPTIAKNHIEMLKDKGLYYNNPNDLFHILMSFEKQPDIDWNCYKEHTPMNGIMKFKQLLLDGLL